MHLRGRIYLGFERKSKIYVFFGEIPLYILDVLTVDFANIKIQHIFSNLTPSHRSQYTYHDLNVPSSMFMDAW